MALAFVERSYEQPYLRLDAVAEHVRVSPHHLSCLIKKETGLGFRQHRARLRLDRARCHLKDSLLSIKEIAAAVGYSNTSTFDRDFRRTFGCSPTELRRRMHIGCGCQALTVCDVRPAEAV